VLEGLKSANIAEPCHRYEIAPNLYYRSGDEALEGASAPPKGVNLKSPVNFWTVSQPLAHSLAASLLRTT
jgi:hypothetical protein